MTQVQGSKGCFAGSTKVSTLNGLVDICDIKVGDEVLSFNDAGEVELDTVFAIHHHEPEEVWVYKFWGGHSVVATPSHWVQNQYGAFVPIGTLTVDDCIVDGMGHLRPLVSSEQGPVIPVYNLTVQKNRTYFADGIRVHNQGTGARHPRVKGSKGKSGGGSAAKEDPNTLRSRAVVKTLELTSQGETFGLADKTNPLKSVYFDDTPLMNADGTLNYGSAYVEERVGTAAQTYIDGFPSANNPVSVGVNVVNGTPVVRTVAADTDAAVVTIQVQALYKTDKSTGDISGNSVSLTIQRKRTVDVTWTTIVQDTITGKTMRPYERDYRIPRAGTSGSWDIRVTRNSADDVDTSTQSVFAWSRFVEKKDAKLAYPGKAYIAVAADAESTGGNIPKVSFDYKGMLVKVPSNYNPVTRTYTGSWNGTFSSTLQWTDNPAWCIYDMLLDPVYGLGEFITESMLDRYSFYDAAQYNDQSVPFTDANGATTSGPRFTFNAFIQTQEDAFKLIQSMAAVCNSFVGEAGGYISLIQDRPKTAKVLVTRANTIDGFTYQGTNILARHTSCNVTFNDPSDNYLPKTVTEKLASAITRYGDNPIDIMAFGCVVEAQARRTARWLLETENSALQTLTYRAAWDHINVVPGDIIKVNDPHVSGFDGGGRVKASTTGSATLDRLIDHSAPGTYTIDFIQTDGSIVNRTITGWGTSGGLSTITFAPTGTAVPVETVFAITGPVAPRQFRVLSLKEDSPGTFTVTALQHDPDKYARIENGVVIPAPTYSNVGTTPPKAPTGLQALPESYFDNQTTKRRVRFTWQTAAADYIVRHSVKWRVNGKAFTTVDNISQPELLIEDAIPGQYEFLVTVYNIVNVASPSASLTFAFNTGDNGTPVTSSTLQAPINVGVDYPGVSTRGTAFWTEDVVIGWDDPPANINLSSGVVDVTSAYFVEFLRPDNTVMYSTTVNRPAKNFNWSYALNAQKFSTTLVPTGTFKVRVTSIDAFGRKGVASSVVTISVLAMGTPTPITTPNAWTTGDVRVVWDCFPVGAAALNTTPVHTLGFFKRYRVQVKDGATVINTYYTTTNEFTYTLAENKKNTGASSPKHTLTFEVRAEDDFGGTSLLNSATFTAAAPPAANSLLLVGGGTTFATRDVATTFNCTYNGAPFSQSPVFGYYNVVVTGPGGTKTYRANSEFFTYTFAQNVKDNSAPFKSPNIVVTPYDVFGRDASSASNTFNAVAPPSITGVTQASGLGTTFTTQDLSVVWTAELNAGRPYSMEDLFDTYVVEVKPFGGGTTVRTVAAPKELFTYAFTDNRKDFSAPTRSMQVVVRARDVFGQLSSTASANFSNPSPAAPVATFSGGYNIEHFQLVAVNEPDVAGYRVWVSKTNGFTPSDADLLTDGPALFGSFPVDPGTTYYARTAAYDYFGKTGLTLSPQYSFSTLSDVKTQEYKTSGIVFTPSATTNTVSWTSGTLYKVGSAATSVTVASGTTAAWSAGAGGGGPMFIYAVYPSSGSTTTLQFSYDLTAVYSNPTNTVSILGLYRGGTDLTQGDGRVLMDGGYLLPQTIGANALVANQAVITGTAQLGVAVVGTASIADASIINAKMVNATIETLKLKNGAITNIVATTQPSALTYDGSGAVPSGQSGTNYKDSGWRNIIQQTIVNPDANSGGIGSLTGNAVVFFGGQMSTGLTTSGGGGKQYYDGSNFSAGTHAYRLVLEALDMFDGQWYPQMSGPTFFPYAQARAEETDYFVGDRPFFFSGAIGFRTIQLANAGVSSSAATVSSLQANQYVPLQQFRLTLQCRTSIYNQVSTAENFGSFPPISTYQPFKYYTGLSGSNIVQLNSGVGTQVTYLPGSTLVRNSYIISQAIYK